MPNAWRSRDCEATLPYVCKKYLNHTDHEVVGKCFHLNFLRSCLLVLSMYSKSSVFLITHSLHLAKASFIIAGIKMCNKIIPDIQKSP